MNRLSKKYITLKVLAIFVSTFCFAQQNKDSIFFKHIITTLSSDSLHGRAPGTSDELKSANYIAHIIQQLKFKSKYQKFEFKHPSTNTTIQSRNIYCYINNKADSTILIGAHYDHIGLGQYKSLSYGKSGQIHNGADDNASGVAMMLGLLNHYKYWGSKKYNYLFVAYSAHELGLFGSNAFSKLAMSKFPPIKLVVNFDMVGRLDIKEKILAVYGYESLSKINITLPNTLQKFNVRQQDNALIKQTDGVSFIENSRAVISFTTGTHDDYHKISDDEAKINYSGMLDILDFMEHFLALIR